jgi:TPR repeat protein
VRKDLAQAIQWYRQASEQGYKPSQRALRELGDRGD